jgi:hypothetical protein
VSSGAHAEGALKADERQPGWWGNKSCKGGHRRAHTRTLRQCARSAGLLGRSPGRICSACTRMYSLLSSSAMREATLRCSMRSRHTAVTIRTSS